MCCRRTIRWRVAEHAATLDHMLGGRLNIAFVRGYQARWFPELRRHAWGAGDRSVESQRARR